MAHDIQRVVAFWFNRNPMEWIVAPKGFDAQCKSKFGDLESLISLAAARCLCEALKPRAVGAEEHNWFDMGVAAAKEHVEQMTRFERYPTRNAILGRKSTGPEE